MDPVTLRPLPPPPPPITLPLPFIFPFPFVFVELFVWDGVGGLPLTPRATFSIGISGTDTEGE